MSDILPLLLLPAVAGWWFAEWKQRRARASLRHAIACARRPLILDAGAASVITVARSLETVAHPAERRCPWWMVGRARTVWEVRELIVPLGLTLDEVIRPRRDRLWRTVGFDGASRFSGIRHARRVDITLGVSRSTITIALPHQTLRRLSIIPGADGALTADGDLSAGLEAALHTLAASRRWCGMRLDVDGALITLDRPADSPGSWLHDLWLAEFVADLVEPAPLPIRAPSRATAPRHGAPSALALGG